MPDIVRTFRLLGHLKVHTTRSVEDAARTPAQVVDIFHAGVGADGERHCLVRVASLTDPNEMPGLPTALPAAKENVFIKGKAAEYKDQIVDGEETTFWISRPDVDPKAQVGGTQLSLFGAIVLDQYEAHDGSEPTKRFPLIPFYETPAGPWASTVTFGHDKGTDLRIEVAFAMPAATQYIPGTAALPSGGIYRTVTEASDPAAQHANLVTARRNIIGTRYQGHIETFTTNRLLGDFGLADTAATEDGTFEIPQSKYLPQANQLLALTGVSDPIDDTQNTGRVRFYSRRLTDGAGYEYAAAVSRRITTRDEQLSFAAQFGAGFHAQTIDVQAFWRVTLNDGDVLGALKSSGTTQQIPGQLRTQLRFRDRTRLQGQNPPYAFAPKSDELVDYLHGGGLAYVASLGAQARGAMQTVDRQPQSVLPDLFSTSRHVTVSMVGYAAPTQRAMALGGQAPLAAPDRMPGYTLTLDTTPLPTQNQAQEQKIADETTLLEQAEGFLGAPRTAPLDIIMQLPGFDDGMGDHLVHLGHDARAAETDTSLGDMSITIANAKDSAGTTYTFPGYTARLGALRLVREKALLVGLANERDPTSTLTIRPAARRIAQPGTPDLDVQWRLGLAADRAEPVTTDTAHGDRSARPDDLLILEAAQPPTNEDAALRVQVMERIRDDQDRHLTASIFDTSDSLGDDLSETYTILTQRPWQALRFSRLPFTASGGAKSEAVAEYDSDRREWRQLKAAETYRYTMPPAVVGEAADKPGEWEIIDPENQGSAAAPLGPLPGGTGNLAERHAVDMRLSPPSTFWVEPSDLERNYFLAQYNVRGLFSQQGDFGIGVALHALRAEFVYGLATGLKVPEATADRAKPRLASTAALTGRMLPAERSSAGSAVARRWPELRRALTDHAERLEVVDIDTSRRDPYQPARFDSGLTHALRQTSLTRPPAGLDPARVGDATQEPTLEPPRFAEHGLPGGALWPLESANVAYYVARNPKGENGTLSDIALTPMGVSGNQSVRFLNDLVTIITETTDGHLHRQRVEVLGRIGVLWHRAKHVVIYERTTAPSAQFTPEGTQRRTHRPVLRKVEEFVEILQPARKYPDTPLTEERGRGFLEEVRFNSTIIHVNSAWGRDLGKFGWEVPLWDRQAAATRPQVYPFPDVAFVNAAEGDSAAPQIAQDCLDVPNLYFYTDPSSAETLGADTDLWPARLGVDYGAFSDPIALDKLLDIPATEVRRTAASRLMPGTRRFTWRVAPAPVRTRINTGRGDKPVFAGVESVSLARNPTPAAGTTLPDTLMNAVDVLSANMPEDAGTKTSFPLTANSMPDDIAQVKRVRDALKNLQDGTGNAAQIKATASALANELDVENLSQALGNARAKAEAIFADPSTADLANKIVKADKAECTALANRARDALLRRRMLLSRHVRSAVGDVIQEIDKIETVTPDQLRKDLENEIKDATKNVFDGLNEGVIDVRRALVDAQAITNDWRAQATLALNRAKARVTSLRGAYDNSKPWSENRLDKALAQIANAFDGAEREAQDALAESRQRFATELKGQSRAIGTRLSMVMQQTLAAERNTLGTLKEFRDVARDAAADVVTQLDKLPTEAQMDHTIVKLKAKADTLTGTQGQAAVRAVNLAKEIKAGVQSAKDKTTEITTFAKNQAINTIGDAEVATKNVAEKTVAVLADLNANVTAFQETVAEVADEAFDALANLSLSTLRTDVIDGIKARADGMKRTWSSEIDVIEDTITRAENWADDQIATLDKVVAQAQTAANTWFAKLNTALDAVETELPDKLRKSVDTTILKPLLDAAFGAVDWPETSEQDAVKAAAKNMLRTLADQIEETLKDVESFAVDGIEQAEALCNQLVGLKDALRGELVAAKAAIAKVLGPEFEKLKDVIDAGVGNIEDIVNATDDFLEKTADIANEMAEAADTAQAYVQQGLEIIDDLGDAKPTAVPGLALKLISAATASPEIAALKTNADRIRVLMKETEDTLKTPALKGLFDQLGDALKAMGLDFNFDTFGDQFDIKAPEGDLLRKLLPDFGGIDLSNMLPAAKLPGGLRDAVKVTHDLDTKAGRAWVQADVNLKMPKREKMFSIGPFTLYLRKSTLAARIRADASKDSQQVATTDSASMTTTIEAVVSGQVMVTLQDVVIRYSSKTKLDFDIDPKKIKIHKSLKFIQDTVGKIFGDGAGALKFVKENGIPVGVEHQLAMPPLSLMYGTSGVSNIQIANRFSLRAYPDFIITNRFNLSRAELPFLFTFFIIGGTGYLQVDTEYRPFDKRLMVVAAAGAGGSASLGFAFGPVNGAVFITLSVTLRYQKRLGGPSSPDDGLSVSLLLVIAGNVSLFGMVTVYLGLRLSIRYHESGRVDGLGQLSVEVRISRFFKLRYSTSITYKLRDGQSTTQVEENTDVSGEAVDAVDKARALAKARKSI
jgi:hypothetical protein